ncbi:MAG: LysM peptidoglycan-binding domain-containing protein [Flavobacteriaceae bacterium]|jgi:LysM repeat protein|nr:LysM peptidoglycan-binding domain-containing protein [Flavobacteriaceae bacterium]MDB4306900.1 LysM peptidoglycan-binding domain-containing protein [Flavobacteriaceae bacterium]
MGIVFASESAMKKKLFLTFLFSLFLSLSFGQTLTPDEFIFHRVKKNETLYGLAKEYGVTEAQLLEYNPLLEKIGLKRRMTVRIPVYGRKISKTKETKAEKTVAFQYHTVAPKETKWRLAYRYGTTIQVLDSLNPQLKDGLKIGQEIRIPIAEEENEIPEFDSAFNYYKVLPKEGYYRIEKKLGVTQTVLDSLNPILLVDGLKAGMILKVPGMASGNLKVESDLLVERPNLQDSLIVKDAIKLSLLLPFNLKTINLDSVADTAALLKGRNLSTIALDFYSGVLSALEAAKQQGITVELDVFDTANNTQTLQKIIQEEKLETSDAIIGPLIPSNFDFVSQQARLQNTPKIAPLSSMPVVLRKNVFQTITPEKFYREKMYHYLDQVLDSTQNVLIIADAANSATERALKQRFPWSQTMRPQSGNYVLPETVDSLLLDSKPNKVILESNSFALITSVISQMNAQNSEDRNVQLFTTYKGNIYENDNLSLKIMGGIQFTYPAGSYPLQWIEEHPFVVNYKQRFGKLPSKEAIRAYDVTRDLIQRLTVKESLSAAVAIGETEQVENRFHYVPESNGSFVNKGLYLLQHQSYEIIEIKEWGDSTLSSY